MLKWIIAGGIVIGLAGAVLIPQQQITLQVINTLSQEAKERMVGHRERLNQMRDYMPLAVPVEVDWKAMYQEWHGQDPMIVQGIHSGNKIFTEAEIDAYNELHVIAFNQYKGINESSCIGTQIIEYGEVSEVTTCKGGWEHARHPYHETGIDTLMEWANSGDADAAAILVTRISFEEHTSIDREAFAILAARLSGKSGPLMKAAGFFSHATAYSENSDGSLGPIVDTPREIATRYMLESLAQDMGDPRADPAPWFDILVNYNTETANHMVAILPEVLTWYRQQLRGEPNV